MKNIKHQIDDTFDWEDMYGTDHITWFEKYQLNLPYWVAYMDKDSKNRYIEKIRKTKEWN